MLMILLLLFKIMLCLYKIAINYLLSPFFYAIYSFMEGHFNIKNAYSRYCRRYEKMTVKELKNFIHENYYRQIQFPKENSYYSMKHHKKTNLLLLATKLIEKIPDATNAKQNDQSYLKRKNAIKNNY